MVLLAVYVDNLLVVGVTVSRVSGVARLKPEISSSISTITDSVELCDSANGIMIPSEICDRTISAAFLVGICSCIDVMTDFD